MTPSESTEQWICFWYPATSLKQFYPPHHHAGRRFQKWIRVRQLLWNNGSPSHASSAPCFWPSLRSLPSPSRDRILGCAATRCHDCRKARLSLDLQAPPPFPVERSWGPLGSSFFNVVVCFSILGILLIMSPSPLPCMWGNLLEWSRFLKRARQPPPPKHITGRHTNQMCSSKRLNLDWASIDLRHLVIVREPKTVGSADRRLVKDSFPLVRIM